ncbi:MAG: acyl-CoA dehydrogenase family protein [Pseudomonadales bacterium]|jgi:alkylation response protein AidB-like acyl-CoA dehydrogenase|nr:acyl-CoA dehydrogenase family protein [Pseudomonadales bacterium]MDP7357701.1 acyl-CoA dehydrogenase family protein [Pseudomonadales bacterium]MDP7596103.1 acyl-CoA dehydrogenase family protein [Pseudomonadales bacterium]HJN50300.1 acyl-CoA dehydrogenase family protein [Pseudomonadales bacterium]|tara:strand:+ start:5534 stop:6622 length:1089 start_codon:yes stop_codon:yes gene_type:complete
MEFNLNEEQRMLQESVLGFLESECPLERVRTSADAGETHIPDVWSRLTDLGIPGILIPEDQGGVGLGFLEAALVAEAMGRTVAPVPFVGSSVMAPVALLAAGSDEQKDRWLARIAAGEVLFGVGVTEQIGSREDSGVDASADGLQGKAMFVLDGMDADMLIIADRQGALHLVEAAAKGVSRRKLVTIDRTRSVAEVVFEGAAAEILPGSASDREPLLSTIDAGRVILAADSLGASQTMLDKSVEYAKERKQFNRVIGSFQAVKHMCADMAAELEPCRSLVWYAAHAASVLPDEARLMACHAKAHLSDIGQFVARKSTEVHGGMGFTDLLGLHYWFKRIGFNRQLLGAPELVREEAASIQGWV